MENERGFILCETCGEGLVRCDPWTGRETCGNCGMVADGPAVKGREAEALASLPSVALAVLLALPVLGLVAAVVWVVGGGR